MEMVNVLNLVLGILIVVVMVLGGLYVLMVFKGRKEKEQKDKTETTNTSGKKEKTETSTGYSKESIYKFMEFDEILDNMIIRKNKTQYIMVIQCQGINYDLMSEDEKISVEEGFVQFLNTLRFPIQFYIQTRSLNLREIIEEYKASTNQIAAEISELRVKIEQAKLKKDIELIERLEFDKRKKENILAYGLDIADYVGKMSLNKNVLQQKTYVIVSYYAAEIGGISNYSKEEIDNMCFSELYTRCQTILHALAPSEVTGKILDSEELAELLYVAYNRDDSELIQLSRVLNSGYDSLYSTAKDTMEKKKEALEEKIVEAAVDLVTDSIYVADEELKDRQLRQQEEIQQKALEILEQYEDQMGEELYEATKKQILKESEMDEGELSEEPRPKTRRIRRLS